MPTGQHKSARVQPHQCKLLLQWRRKVGDAHNIYTLLGLHIQSGNRTSFFLLWQLPFYQHWYLANCPRAYLAMFFLYLHDMYKWYAALLELTSHLVVHRSLWYGDDMAAVWRRRASCDTRRLCSHLRGRPVAKKHCNAQRPRRAIQRPTPHRPAPFPMKTPPW